MGYDGMHQAITANWQHTTTAAEKGLRALSDETSFVYTWHACRGIDRLKWSDAMSEKSDTFISLLNL